MSEETVIALGFFDGVHIGHGALLRKTAERAKELGCRSAAFTFDRAPKEFVLGTAVPLLTDVEERSILIRQFYGMDEVFVEPFDQVMMTMPWEDFITELLVGKYHAVHLVAGHDFRFGHRNEGTPERLREKCAQLGIGCDIVAKVELDGVTVSSTHIRALIEEGQVCDAARFLGRPYEMRGPVQHGQGLGTKSLFPTANLLLKAHAVVPKRGVYATQVYLQDGACYTGVTNVGVRPTVSEENTVTIETYLLDFSGDLYGGEIRVAFLDFLREERPFPSVQELRSQIAEDIERAKACRRP